MTDMRTPDRHFVQQDHGCYRRAMLEPNSAVPDVSVWRAPREEAAQLHEVLGAGYALLCFYVFDWSPG